MISKSPQETHKCASQVAKSIKTLPALILLSGEMGAGKTEWVRGFAKAYLGDSDTVSSPSYSLINKYTSGKKQIYHADLYRLNSVEDLESTGLWDLLTEKAVVVVEWPFKVDVHWPSNLSIVSVVLKIVNETQREITIS